MVRWQLADGLRANGVPASLIDAGYEWDGWHTYWDALASEKNASERSPWWIQKLATNNAAEYIISFSTLERYLPTYRVVQSVSFRAANPNRTLYVLQNTERSTP